jgi:uncharacterized protein (PEP-CTERM system associated)
MLILLFATNPSLQAAQILFTPSLSLTEEYTDNIDLDPENEKEDFITTAGNGHES